MTRGPVRKASLTMNNIDLKNFKTTVDRLVSFLEYQWGTIDRYMDLQQDFKVEMMSQMYQDNGY